MDNHPSLTIMNDNISILSIVLAQPDRIIWIDERLLDMINNDNEFENNILNKDELDKITLAFQNKCWDRVKPKKEAA